MTDKDLATLWCALNCSTGPDGDKLVFAVMQVLKREIGEKTAKNRWRELVGVDKLSAVNQIMLERTQ